MHTVQRYDLKACHNLSVFETTAPLTVQSLRGQDTMRPARVESLWQTHTLPNIIAGIPGVIISTNRAKYDAYPNYQRIIVSKYVVVSFLPKPGIRVSSLVLFACTLKKFLPFCLFDQRLLISGTVLVFIEKRCG